MVKKNYMNKVENMNLTKPKTQWEKKFDKKFHKKFKGYYAKSYLEDSKIWRYDTDNPYELLAFIKAFFRKTINSEVKRALGKVEERIEDAQVLLGYYRCGEHIKLKTKLQRIKQEKEKLK